MGTQTGYISLLRAPPLIAAVAFVLITIAPLESAHEPASRLADSDVVSICSLIDQGRYSEAEDDAVELLAEVENEWGRNSLETAEVLDMLTEALWRGGKATDSETLAFADRALRIRRLQLGNDHPLVADSLVEKSNVLEELTRFSEAEALLKRALAVYQRAYGASDAHVAMVLNNLGNLYYKMGLYEDAAERLTEALSLYESACGSDCPEMTAPLGNLANVLASVGDNEQALALLERELNIDRRTFGEDHPRTATTLGNLGHLLAGMGRYKDARAMLERAIAIREKALGRDHPLLASAICNLAILESTIGRVREADNEYQRCIDIYGRALGNEHPDTAQATANYGAFLEPWDPVAARSEYERAREIFLKAHGTGHPKVAWMDTALGRVQTQLGDLPAAQDHLKAALRYWQQHPELEVALQIGALQAMGDLEMERGRLPKARESFDKAMALELESHGPEHHHLAGAETRIAAVALRQESFIEAEQLLLRALDIQQRTLGDVHPDYAAMLERLGDLKSAAGAPDHALRHYRRALSIVEQVYGGQAPDTAQLRLKIARCLSELGSRRSAAVSALQAEHASRSSVRLLLTGMTESEGLRYVTTRTSGLDLAFSLVLASDDPELAAAAVDALVRSRALTLDEMAGRWRVVQIEGDPDLEAAADKLAAARSRLAYLVVRGPDPANVAGYTALLEEARDARERAEQDLANRSRPLRRASRQRQAGLDEVAAAMPPGSRLVGFARFRLVSFDEDPTASSEAGRLSYLAYVLAPAGPPDLVLLGDAADIDGLVERIRSHVQREADGLGLSEGWSEGLYRRDAELLRRRIWDPLTATIGNADSVFIVPDGSLHLVNPAALPVGKSAYLIEEGPRIHLLSAERDLALDDEVHRGEGLLAVGNPDFNQPGVAVADTSPPASTAPPDASSHPTTRGYPGGRRSACASIGSLRFDRLVATEAELLEVIGLWGRRRELHGGSLASPAVIDLRGRRATETALKQSAAGKRVIHLATHGFFFGETCPFPVFPTGDDQLEPVDRPGILESPLLRSGLAMAGANLRGTAGPNQDDGILTAEEAATLDLGGVEWAVLSACDSGLGDIEAGEGVLGLRRAFSVAGARTLIMSLWQVEDQPTREWMRLLYEGRFVQGLDTADSVRRATLELLQQRRRSGLSTHPFYWAGFVAAGEWR
jgi:tetratricopeptide (TPR) repeat protein/CHAT domain-containing protein